MPAYRACDYPECPLIPWSPLMSAKIESGCRAHARRSCRRPRRSHSPPARQRCNGTRVTVGKRRPRRLRRSPMWCCRMTVAYARQPHASCGLGRAGASGTTWRRARDRSASAWCRPNRRAAAPGGSMLMSGHHRGTRAIASRVPPWLGARACRPYSNTLQRPKHNHKGGGTAPQMGFGAVDCCIGAREHTVLVTATHVIGEHTITHAMRLGLAPSSSIVGYWHASRLWPHSGGRYAHASAGVSGRA